MKLTKQERKVLASLVYDNLSRIGNSPIDEYEGETLDDRVSNIVFFSKLHDKLLRGKKEEK